MYLILSDFGRFIRDYKVLYRSVSEACT